MIKRIAFSGIIMLAVALSANAQQYSFGKLKSVTVYSRGAEMVHTAPLAISPGVSKVYVTNVAANVDESSIQVSAPAGVTVMSATWGRRASSRSGEQAPALKRIKDSLDIVKLRLSQTRNLRIAQEGTLALLDKNQMMDSKGASVAELAKLADYYTAKQVELRNSIYGLMEKEAQLTPQIAQLEQKLRETDESMEDAKGQITLLLQSKNGSDGNMEIRYVARDAGWSTHYDLKLESISKPLKLVYKANVYQTTSVAWKNVKLTLNTGNPSSAGTAPELSTWFLYPALRRGIVAGRADALNEVVVVGYAGSADKAEARAKMAPAPPPPMSAVPSSIVQHQTSASFDIDIPYDIAGDGQGHSVVLKEMDLPSGYTYFSVPKLDQDAFLVANVKDFASYNLLPGEANIMIGNLYAGKTYIDPQATEDTLKLSLGRDRQVVVRRELMAQVSGTKMIGGSVRKTFTYEIRVRNGKQESIKMQLKDQYPVSTDKNVEVELTESSGATADAETGELSWELDMKPGESKTLRLTYTVKHPKGQQYQGL